MEPFTDNDALDLLIQVRRDPSHGAHLTIGQVERIGRRILSHLSDQDLAKALEDRLNTPPWTDNCTHGSANDL
jgi:hypothetical protein